MAGIQLNQPGGVGVLNADGAQHPAPVTVDEDVVCQLSAVGITTATYRWLLTKPSGSTSVLSSSTSAGPSFMPDVEDGSYSVSLFDDQGTQYILDIVTATTGVSPGGADGSAIQVTLGTYADVRAASFGASTPPAAFMVQGRTAVGDGGEGQFVYVSDSALADNDGTVLEDGDGNVFHRVYSGDIDDRWFGATTSLLVDSAAAINAAIQVASQNLSATGFAFAGQSVVVNGRRRCSVPVVVEGGVTLRGLSGADIYSASALVFDQGVDGVVVEDHTGPSAHSSLGTVVRDLQILQFNKTGSPLADAAPYVNGLYPLVRNKGLNCKAKVHLENLHVSGWSGDGITIAGLNTNCWSMSGFITIDRCFGMGIVITGGETSAGNMAAMLNVFACGSVGIYAHGFLGNNYTGAIHTQGNGYKEVGGVWNHGDVDQVAFIWSSGKTVAAGEVILPPTADKNGYVYVARNAGTLATAGAFPAWSTTVGDTFTSGDVEVEVWAVEGTSVWSPGGGVKFNQFTWLYAELDQNPMQLLGNDMMNGGIVDLEIDKNSVVLNGFTRGRKLPTSISTRGATTSGTLNDWAFFLNVEVGGQFASPLTALRFNADTTVGLAPDAAYVGYYCDQGYVSIDWNPTNKRWSHSYGLGWVGKTQCGGRSLPSPGAECFQSLWVGPDLKERRITALPSTSLFLPDFTQATSRSLALGAYQDGDLILNTCGTLETPTQRYPVAWRPVRFGGGEPQTWSGADTWLASHYYRPGECIIGSGNIWRALSEGTSGLSEPSWGSPSVYTTKVDNNFSWEFVGPDGGSFEPVITQAPTMLSKNVAAGGTITLTEDESAHERIKFTGAPGGALSVVVAAGAGAGWVRTFWNICGQTVTVKGSSGDGGVALLDGTLSQVFSDGTTAIAVSDRATVVSAQRVARGMPFIVEADADVDEYGRVVINTTAGTAVKIPVEVPDGCTLTDILVRVIGGGNASLPAVMPRFRLRKLVGNTNTTSTSSDSVDASANVGAYNGLHSIVMNSIGETIDNTVNRYVVEFVSESGANATTGFTVVSTELYFTVTDPDRGAA